MDIASLNIRVKIFINDLPGLLPVDKFLVNCPFQDNWQT